MIFVSSPLKENRYCLNIGFGIGNIYNEIPLALGIRNIQGILALHWKRCPGKDILGKILYLNKKFWEVLASHWKYYQWNGKIFFVSIVEI